MSDDLVSVIVPIYNSVFYLEKCIESILIQTYSNIEIILVDDGSTDGSGDICDNFAKADSRIKCIHKQNGGVSSARNGGIDICKGDFICFVDSDDIIGKDYINHLMKLIEDYNCDWALSAVNQYDSFMPDERVLLDFSDLLYDKFYLLNKEYVIFGPCCKIYKSSFIYTYNLRFPEKTHYGEDLLFNFSYMRKIKTAAFWNINDYSYEHVNCNSLSAKYRRTMFDDELSLADVKRVFYEEKQVYNREFEKLLNVGIFDCGYNAIIKSYFRHEEKDIKKYVKTILMNESFHNAAKDVPKGKYSSVILFLMKNRCLLIILFLLCISEIKDSVLHGKR